MYNSGIGTPYWFEWEIGILECLNMLQDGHFLQLRHWREIFPG